MDHVAAFAVTHRSFPTLKGTQRDRDVVKLDHTTANCKSLSDQLGKLELLKGDAVLPGKSKPNMRPNQISPLARAELPTGYTFITPKSISGSGTR
ncbi:hypothetical protein BGAL_0243g00010 [Botrytis galanthina]|uniref:Uncharacterized protein n=1 Tax=Botrytis galanthina TaxID=278940 RepID=A0A4S8QVQ0_9HELO|nr:hypothetical protein BGAL_0243g00010 [Botrytis galanthina]